jgi:hypothetical protein
MDRIAEIKLDHRRRAGGHGVDHGCAATLDLTLDVEANEMFEAWRRIVETSSQHGPTPFPLHFPDGREGRLSGYCVRMRT